VGLKEVPEQFELPADLKVIIDFAIEDNYGVAILGKNGLIPGREIDNLETGCTERAGSRLKHSLLVRAAMNKGIRRAPYALLIRAPGSSCESNNAAQVSMPSSMHIAVKRRHAE
jgi:hypothetical protein